MVSTAILSHPFPSPFTLDPWILPIGDTALHNGHYFRVPTASSMEVSFLSWHLGIVIPLFSQVGNFCVEYHTTESLDPMVIHL